MTLRLHVDGPRWRRHLRRVADARPGLVPVAKGNGYGFTVANLARRAAWLGSDLVAVGTYAEAVEVGRRFDGDILVLEPWRPFRAVTPSRRLVHTVSRPADLADLTAAAEDAPRVVLEGLTSMRRHGMPVGELRAALGAARGVRVEGVALHLPLGDGHVDEIDAWIDQVPHDRWFVSHATESELAALRARRPEVSIRPRVGTDLWLGDRGALAARAVVTDVHPVERGDRVGYRQRRVRGSGHLLVVSGGTAHGIGLEAPTPAATTRQRAVSLAKGGLDATGRALSPFVVAGKQRWFVEPPHMQISMVFLPAGTPPPAIGDEVDVRVRFTTTLFDEVLIS